MSAGSQICRQTRDGWLAVVVATTRRSCNADTADGPAAFAAAAASRRHPPTASRPPFTTTAIGVSNTSLHQPNVPSRALRHRRRPPPYHPQYPSQTPPIPPHHRRPPPLTILPPHSRPRSLRPRRPQSHRKALIPLPAQCRTDTDRPLACPRRRPPAPRAHEAKLVPLRRGAAVLAALVYRCVDPEGSVPDPGRWGSDGG